MTGHCAPRSRVCSCTMSKRKISWKGILVQTYMPQFSRRGTNRHSQQARSFLVDSELSTPLVGVAWVKSTKPKTCDYIALLLSNSSQTIQQDTPTRWSASSARPRLPLS